MDKKELNQLSWQIYNLPSMLDDETIDKNEVERYNDDLLQLYSNCLEVIPSAAKAIKQAELYIEMYDNEIDRLKKKKQKAERFIEKINESIMQYMKKQGTNVLEWGIEEDDLKIEIKKSEKVIIEDVNKLPWELKEEVWEATDKPSIKKYIIEHPETEGAYIEISEYLKINS